MRRLSIPFTTPSDDRAKRRLTSSGTACPKITYAQYVGFWFKQCLSCYSSVWRGHHRSVAVFYCAIERLTLDAIDAKRNNRYSVTSFLTTPRACQLMYYVYIRVVILGVFSRHSSQYRGHLMLWRCFSISTD